MKKIKTLFVGLLCSLLFAFTVNAQELDKWASSNPDAAEAFGYLIKSYPDALHYIINWDVKHPDQSQALVSWGVANRGLSLNNFQQQHQDWTDLDSLTTTYLDEARGFLKWSRAFTPEAVSLMSHPGGLKWESEHLSATNTQTTK